MKYFGILVLPVESLFQDSVNSTEEFLFNHIILATILNNSHLVTSSLGLKLKFFEIKLLSNAVSVISICHLSLTSSKDDFDQVFVNLIHFERIIIASASALVILSSGLNVLFFVTIQLTNAASSTLQTQSLGDFSSTSTNNHLQPGTG